MHVVIHSNPTSKGVDVGCITKCDNAEVLKTAPQLVGLSRKGFLGQVTGRGDPRDRDVATAAANALSIASGADVIRVHNVRAGTDAARVADALLKHNPHRSCQLPW
jgi:dihydropteroate synthase